MAVTIFEALQNAEYNLNHNGSIGVMLAKEQLTNAVELLDKGYELTDLVEPLLDKYGSIDKVPNKVN